MAWCERMRVMAESAVTFLDPRSAGTYKAGVFYVDWAVSALYTALRKHSIVKTTTL